MATEMSRGNLFEPELVGDLINKVVGKSTLAILSGQKPIPFNGMKEFTFDFENKLYSVRRYENLIEIKEVP